MELRAAVGLQSSFLAPRLGSLRLWGGGRGGRAGAGRLIDGRDGNEDFDFWEYEANQQHSVNVQEVEDEVETPVHVRPEFVVPRVKFTRESKGLKPTYRVFSKDRRTAPNPRVNPFSVLMKMIDPANDDEYLEEDGESAAHDMKEDGDVLLKTDSFEDGESAAHDVEEDGDVVLKTDGLEDGDEGLGARLSDFWSDAEDEFDDEDLEEEEEEEKEEEGGDVVEEDGGEDPLRRFLSSRSGNRDSKQEGRVFKFNKRARKAESKTTTFEVVVPGKNKVVVDSMSGEKQAETSAMREVLQIAYNLPKDRALEDYMAPFVHEFSTLQANLILEALCGDDLTDQVLSFFRWMRSHQLWSSRSLSLLFTFLGRMEMPDEALTTLAAIPEERQFHSVEVYNALITCLVNCNRQNEVPAMLEKMKALGNEPDAVTFSILMNSATENGRSLHEVWGLYQDMVARGVTPSVNVFGTLIKAFCAEGLLKEALLITTEMEKLKVPMNVVIYNILIHAYGRAGKMEEAEGLMAEMREKGVQPNVGTYNTLISGYLEANQIAVAEELVAEMESSGLSPDVVTFTALLGAFGRQGQSERAAQVFNRMEARGVRPNSMSYTALISSYAAGGWPEKAAKAFETMEKQGVSATVETFTALLDAYRRAGDVAMVDTVRRRMKKEGCVPTRITYMTMLDAFQKQGRYKEARDLIEEFKNQGLKPDLMVYNMLLNSYMRGGRHFKAPEVVREMKEAGFQPDSFTYCTLIFGYLRVRDHTMALKYRTQMMNCGQLPDAKTYAKLRAILKAVEARRDVNNYKSHKRKPSKPPKRGSEKAKTYWKRDK